ncbi:MAG: probable oxidoreductase/Short-chain dehydrogenase, partial [uncultured Solirubrobacteraceae bacterium]
ERHVDRGRHPRPDGTDGGGHRSQQRPRVPHVARARAPRRARRHGLPQPRQGPRRRGAPARRGPGRRRGAALTRPRLARLGARVRLGSRARVARPARQQRRRHGAAPAAHRGRVRDAARHEPPRPLRAHRPAARAPAARRRPARRDGVQQRAQDGPHQLRQPQRRPAVLPLGGVRAVQAREPPLRARARPPCRRQADERRGAPRLRGDAPPAAGVRGDRQPDRPRGEQAHERGARAERRHGRAAVAVRGDDGPAGRQLRRPRRSGRVPWPSPARRAERPRPRRGDRQASVDGERGAHRRDVRLQPGGTKLSRDSAL